MSSLLNEKFNFRTKVAGADDVFEKLSDVLWPHLYPQNFVSQTGMHKPRRVLLSGSQETGKTLITRTICGILNIQSKIVRGPEILSHFLGESEKKIRELFADARHDQEMVGDRSDIHIIIFDELDSICKPRTHCDESTRDSVQDNVTTQLLAEIDGLTPIDDILIIGTTNMLSAIEPALLRPGCIDMIIEVHLPDAKARLQIFDIHTKTLLQNGLLRPGVEVKAIIRATSGLTGAHIERLYVSLLLMLCDVMFYLAND